MKSIAIASFVVVSLISSFAHASKVRALHTPHMHTSSGTTAYTCTGNQYRSIVCGPEVIEVHEVTIVAVDGRVL